MRKLRFICERNAHKFWEYLKCIEKSAYMLFITKNMRGNIVVQRTRTKALIISLIRVKWANFLAPHHLNAKEEKIENKLQFQLCCTLHLDNERKKLNQKFRKFKTQCTQTTEKNGENHENDYLFCRKKRHRLYTGYIRALHIQKFMIDGNGMLRMNEKNISMENKYVKFELKKGKTHNKLPEAKKHKLYE